jgi:hypothetical protein
VDYRVLNLATVKNQSPLPFSVYTLDHVREDRIFMKLHIRSSYIHNRQKEGDKYKKAFRIQYGQFECLVVAFSLPHDPVGLQCYINDCLRRYIDHFAVCNCVKILIYSTHDKKQEEHVRQVLHRLNEFGLYCITVNCQFEFRKSVSWGLISVRGFP